MPSQNLKNIYQCPLTHNDVEFIGTFDYSGKPENGYYKTKSSSEKYIVENGLPDFCYPNKKSLPISDKSSLDWYKNNASIYDENLPLTFNTFNTDERREREYLVNLLDLKGDETILEFGCGTCRDSELIAKRLNKNANLYLQDISPEILKIGINKLSLILTDDNSVNAAITAPNTIIVEFKAELTDKPIIQQVIKHAREPDKVLLPILKKG